MMQSAWMLAAFALGHDESGLIIDGVRDVGDDERTALVHANGVLALLTENSPYASLVRAHERWVATFRATYAAAADRRPEARQMLLEELPLAVNSLLFAFRAFADQSERWVMKAFGKASPEHQAYRKQARKEYDDRLGYRLGWNLRNTAQHRSSVLHVRTRADRLPSGEQTFDLDVTMARDAVDSKWQASVRGQIAAISDPIFMAPVIDEIVDGCERIQAQMLLLARPIALPCARRLSNVWDEVSKGRGEITGAALVASDWPRLGVELREPLSLTPIRSDLADLYSQNILQAKALLAD